MSKLSIWILEDHSTNKWTLKHTVSIHKVFAKTKVQIGYLCLESSYSAVIVQPEWNLILFVGAREESAVITYNMNSRKVHVIPTHYIPDGTRDIVPDFIGRPYYGPLFSELESLAK
jgi:hypothetical protein